MSNKIKSRKTDRPGLNYSANLNIQYFKKSFFQRFDKNFLFILLIAILVETVFVSILAMQPIKKYSEKEIRKIQEQFASFILEKEPVQETRDLTVSSGSEVEESTETTEPSETEQRGSGSGEGEGGEGSGTEGSEPSVSPGETPSTSARAMTSAEARREARREVSRKVSSKGLLGILTSSHRTASGDGAVSIFESEGGGSTTDEDLDNILSSVDGLQTLKSSSGGSSSNKSTQGHGQRKGGQTGIDDLITEDQGVNSELINRQGELTIESSPQVGHTRSEQNQYRSAQAIQEVLYQHNKVVKYCYDRELRRYPTLKGKVVVRITISPAGEVINASIQSSTLNNERVERCIIARISHWKDFRSVDPKAGNVTFRQTYVFGY